MKYLKVLYVQVIIGIVLGVLTGWLFPAFAPTAKLISESFINMIKMVITPVIFLTIVLGIAGAGNLKKVGRVGGKGLIYFEVVTTFALIIGLVVANMLKPGVGIATNHLPKENLDKYTSAAKEMNWGEFFSHIIPTNIVDSFAKGDLLQVLFFGVLFSVAITKMGSGGAKLISVFENLNKAFFNVIHIVMKFSPIGAFGGMAYTIGKFGFGSLLLLGNLLLAYYITSLLFIFVVLNLIGRYYGFNVWKLLVYIKEELLIVLGASSSEAVLPNLMEKLEAAGCERSVVGLIIPTGYSFNLDGTTIYLSMATIFLAQVFDINLTLAQQLTIIGVLLVTSKGAAGVTGSGFIVLTSTLTILKVIPLEGLALLIGVDRFMSEGRALTNMIGNTIATVIIAKSEKAIDMGRYKRVVEGRGVSGE
ncbi:MAG: C4-dicarboxylate transporter DctA [Chitinophagaceae bacterium]|nr:C4-dicarboxylate transporter DctA [Chitinophagaceae bacterium]MEA3425725.1 C4-dicarboxylate transporter DctA [Bacteroidota bacterium]MCA6452121.1 C4-dicarboxylate transporter DctA [Chitinophagaceae bacterium]MCA6455843.1 C4-dicarboxylate transporter DctA [Chitinophagaceae bacterium]MCA6459144.1 C4-dicarboxylate transporter DctA [Chitinophagaceae bacterium]